MIRISALLNVCCVTSETSGWCSCETISVATQTLYRHVGPGQCKVGVVMIKRPFVFSIRVAGDTG